VFTDVSHISECLFEKCFSSRCIQHLFCGRHTKTHAYFLQGKKYINFRSIWFPVILLISDYLSSPCINTWRGDMKAGRPSVQSCKFMPHPPPPSYDRTKVWRIWGTRVPRPRPNTRLDVDVSKLPQDRKPKDKNSTLLHILLIGYKLFARDNIVQSHNRGHNSMEQSHFWEADSRSTD